MLCLQRLVIVSCCQCCTCDDSCRVTIYSHASWIDQCSLSFVVSFTLLGLFWLCLMRNFLLGSICMKFGFWTLWPRSFRVPSRIPWFWITCHFKFLNYIHNNIIDLFEAIIFLLSHLPGWSIVICHQTSLLCWFDFHLILKHRIHFHFDQSGYALACLLFVPKIKNNCTHIVYENENFFALVDYLWLGIEKWHSTLSFFVIIVVR